MRPGKKKSHRKQLNNERCVTVISVKKMTLVLRAELVTLCSVLNIPG